MAKELPVPFDKHVVPPIFYSSQMPPYLPMVDVPLEIIFARDYICAQICNMSGYLSSNNAIRMFCYNMLCYNYWENNDFRQVYRLVCGLILHRQRKGNLADIRMSANECIYHILTVYSAFLAFNYPDVMKQLTKEQQLSVKEQLNDYHTLKNIAETMLEKSRDDREFAKWASDILFKCQDLYSLNDTQLAQDCHYVHKAMQATPLNPKVYTKNGDFNPTQTRPVITPPGFQPDVQSLAQQHLNNTPYRPETYRNPLPHDPVPTEVFHNPSWRHPSVAEHHQNASISLNRLAQMQDTGAYYRESLVDDFLTNLVPVTIGDNIPTHPHQLLEIPSDSRISQSELQSIPATKAARDG